jgi:hypothetical protein
MQCTQESTVKQCRQSSLLAQTAQKKGPRAERATAVGRSHVDLPAVYWDQDAQIGRIGS